MSLVTTAPTTTRSPTSSRSQYNGAFRAEPPASASHRTHDKGTTRMIRTSTDITIDDRMLRSMVYRRDATGELSVQIMDERATAVYLTGTDEQIDRFLAQIVQEIDRHRLAEQRGAA